MKTTADLLVKSERIADCLNSFILSHTYRSKVAGLLTPKDCAGEVSKFFERRGEVKLQKAVQMAVEFQNEKFLEKRFIEIQEFIEEIIKQYDKVVKALKAYEIIRENERAVPDLQKCLNSMLNGISREQWNFISNMISPTLLLVPDLSFEKLASQLMNKNTPKLPGQNRIYIQTSKRQQYHNEDFINNKDSYVHKWSLVICKGCEEAGSDYFGEIDEYDLPILSDAIKKLDKEWSNIEVKGMKANIYLLLSMLNIMDGKIIDKNKVCIFNEDLNMGEVVGAQYIRNRIDFSQHSALGKFTPEFQGFRPLIKLEIPGSKE